ncbi:60Kd inner membrane protein-domain-containing protein [Ilyonectria robusta]|uniref:60Kd inner membrane protein-domain-containing protein n=1 Tax=Ilyonectria robusta TaxID=1079257 RepID=UPI001E8D2A42|nr:60Kd inner membrane protein-domain-containing protein [Ilyonectria robusta]KAH8733944.1 60Kd inner membrane protein-domain-containing protein [Ilyonectria robusta]
MLPSRGIVRSLPSGAFQRQLSSQSISRTIPRRLGDGRQFGTAMKSPRAALLAGSRVGAKGVAAPAVLGGARTLSLWGYGKKSEPAVTEAVTTTTTTPTTPEIPVQTTVVSPAASDAVATPAEIVAVAPPAAVDTPVLPTDLDLASIADLGSASILNMPEGLGFLSALGLDYGWGPTSTMQWLLEHVHVYSGWGWGGSIIATALLLRAVMFYPQVRSLRFNAAMNLMRQDPRGKEALELVKKGYQTGDREILQKGQFLNKMVREQYGAYNSGMLWSFVQIPFSFGLFRIISGMSNIPVPSLETSGYLWFSDLTSSDPYFILPALGSGLLFGAMMVNSKYAPASQKAMMKKMMWVFGTVGFIGTTFLSAGVNLMMVSTGAATLLQAVVLNNATIRRAVGLPILKVDEVKYEAPRPTSPGITGLRERLTNNLGDMKKSVTDQVGSYTGNYAGTEAERAEKKRKETMRKLETMRKQLERDEFQKKYKGQ